MKASPRHPVLIDRFLEHSTEIDVDALCDGEDVYIGAVMQHVEEAGIHSGDSACVIPTVSLGDAAVRRIEEQTAALAKELGVVGLMNVQYAVQQSDHGGASIYVLEVNPRGSRTVPFVSKATGVPLARMATRVIAGQKLRDLGLPGWDESVAAGRVPCRRDLEHVAVKEAVLPFPRFPGVDTTLGPEMKSTGEVMGVGTSFPEAFAKASLAAGDRLPRKGSIFISVADAEKDTVVLMALMLSTLGFRILATEGTHRALVLNGIDSEPGDEAHGGHGEAGRAGGRPGQAVRAAAPRAAGAVTTIVDLIEAGEIDMVINIPRGRGARSDGYEIRRAALRQGVPTMTNAAAAHAAVQAIANDHKRREISVVCLQDLHTRLAATANGRGARTGSSGVTAAGCIRRAPAAGRRLDGRFARRSLGRGGRQPGRSAAWCGSPCTCPGGPARCPGQFALLQAEDSGCFLGRPLSVAQQDGRERSRSSSRPSATGTRELCALASGERSGCWARWATASTWTRLLPGSGRLVDRRRRGGRGPVPAAAVRAWRPGAGERADRRGRATARGARAARLPGRRCRPREPGRSREAAAALGGRRACSCPGEIVTEDGSHRPRREGHRRLAARAAAGRPAGRLRALGHDRGGRAGLRAVCRTCRLVQPGGRHGLRRGILPRLRRPAGRRHAWPGSAARGRCSPPRALFARGCCRGRRKGREA